MSKKKAKLETVNEGGYDPSILMARPERVALVAMGQSCQSFMKEQMSDVGMNRPFDQVWTVNRGLRMFPHDLLFVMDDLMWLKEKKPKYFKYLKEYDGPIITSTAYEEIPNAVAYPYQQVLQTIEDDIFNVNTVSYMVAYAIHIGVQELSVYGADFFYPSGSQAEEGGQAVAYLLGMGRHFNMTHRIPGDSTMLYAFKVKPGPGGVARPPYGYHRKDEMAQDAARDEQRKARKALSHGPTTQ
jgi:hypothetical protein